MASRTVPFLGIVSLLIQAVDAENLIQIRKCCGQAGFIDCSASTEAKTLKVPENLMSTSQLTEFKILSEKLDCSGGYDERTNYSLTVDPANSNLVFHPDGYVLIGEDGKNKEHSGLFYHISQYCVNGISSENIEILTCKRHCSPHEPCVNKCCPPDSIYSQLGKRGCVDPGPIKWTPRLFESPNQQLSEDELSKIRPWYSLHQPPAWVSNCERNALHIHVFDKSVAEKIGNEHWVRHRMRYDGEILLWNAMARKWMILEDKENYCVDGFQYEENQVYEHKEEETFLFTCPLKSKSKNMKERDSSQYFGIFTSITSVFALLTVIVYALLWERQQIHGWTIMSYCTSIFFFFAFIAVAHLTKDDESIRNTWGCLVIATMAHYFFLSTFSWLTIISLDLWLMLSPKALGGRGFKRFLAYSIFGWGIPLFIVGLSWTLEILYKDDELSEVPIPMYGVQMCYLTVYSFWEFIYAPATILLCLNLIFFALTTWKLCTHPYSSGKTHQPYLLFVKLFIVVGVLWSFEIISWVMDKTETKWYWQIFDTLNCLSPVVIFFIYVFNYDVLEALSLKYSAMRVICYPNLWIIAKLREKNLQNDNENQNINRGYEMPGLNIDRGNNSEHTDCTNTIIT